MATPNPIQALQNRFVQFVNPALLIEALSAPGFEGRSGNKSLANIGDAVLQVFLKFEGRQQGDTPEQFNQAVTQVASNSNLARRGFALGIDQDIRNNPSQGTFIPDKLTTATMQAIIGAYFVGRSMEFGALQRVIAALGLSYPE